jgi:hypothetical protein
MRRIILRRYSVKMSTVLPRDAVLANQSQVCFVDQRRRLERVVHFFTPEIGRGATAEFVIDQRHESLACLWIPLAPRE